MIREMTTGGIQIDSNELSAPERIVRKYRSVEAQPDDNTADFLKERSELALLQYKAQTYLDKTNDKNAYQLFREWGIPVSWSVSKRFLGKFSRKGFLVTSGLFLATTLIIGVVFGSIKTVKYLTTSATPMSLFDQASYKSQSAQESSANADFTNKSADINPGYKVYTVRKANALVAEFNVFRTKLSESDQAKLPAIPYVK